MNTELSIAAFYYLISQLIFLLSSKFTNFSKRNNIHVASKINSCINAGFAVYYSINYLCGWSKIEDMEQMTLILRGYLIYDTINISYYSNNFDWNSIFVHHLSLFGASYVNLHEQSNAYYLARGLMGEFTNFFLYFGWFLLKFKKDKTKVFKINAYLLIILFFTFRASNFTHLLWEAFRTRGFWTILPIFTLSSLNNFWFYKLAKKGIEMKTTNKITFSTEEKKL
ncbi:uncharacterized protein METZ01_LOCUS494056 [marine metagenome]|uniref:TLC domain-containing protein n=2 Tax=marine metagenome TaxID=408172 RepID=A0A383D9Q6_9ZZZZ|tara:strand:- start:99 stop:773 length:675 start_codon:yes stop_codon:yes gene_type:complete